MSLAGFLLGAFAMFASLYSTQAILPELSRDFGVSPSQAGLTVSAVVLAIAAGAWVWGPFSDRIGRVQAMRLASLLLVVPTLLVALAPSFGVLVAARGLQGLCMPGLLVVGAPYVVEELVPRVGVRAMGWYVGSLVLGGLVGRVGVALMSGVVGWRVACAVLTAFPLAAVVAMRGLPEGSVPSRSTRPLRRLVTIPLLAVTALGCALFATFVGTFTYVPYRLEQPPFELSVSVASLVFLLWAIGVAGPVFGRVAERVGWRRLAAGATLLVGTGVVASVPDALVVLVPALALVACGMFAGYTASQLGVGDVARADRGAASAFFFSAYYASGALGAFVPGIAWERWGWEGVIACDLAALAIALGALLVLARERRRPLDGPRAAPYPPGL